MLTADLVRVNVRGGEVKPLYIDVEKEESLALAAALIRIFEAHTGEARRRLDGELRDFLGSGTAFLLHRGLAKLLFDRCEFQTAAAVDPAALRRAVFENAAARHREARMATFEKGTRSDKSRTR